LLPLYHRARVMEAGLKLPLAIVNIGGVANVTWLGKGEDDILAFDTGPGNALMDDYAKQKIGANYDDEGRLASRGNPNNKIIEKFLAHSYFSKKPPKSLDRNDWSIDLVRQLSTEDAMATLLAMTTASLEKSFEQLPVKPRNIYVCGGGRKNTMLMTVLEGRLPCSFFGVVKRIEALGWNGDAIEAEGFAYLAVRSVLSEPLSLPTTTGVPRPLPGGVLVLAK
jgi:anhydro-N-acetylmuramic acid kinase